jgi:hypothetical protein
VNAIAIRIYTVNMFKALLTNVFEGKILNGAQTVPTHRAASPATLYNFIDNLSYSFGSSIPNLYICSLKNHVITILIINISGTYINTDIGKTIYNPTVPPMPKTILQNKQI